MIMVFTRKDVKKGRADGLKAVLANVGQAARREYSMIEQKEKKKRSVNVNVCKQIMKHYLFSAYIFTQ